MLGTVREAQFCVSVGNPWVTLPTRNGRAPIAAAKMLGTASSNMAERRRNAIQAIAGSTIISVCSENHMPIPTLNPKHSRCQSAPSRRQRAASHSVAAHDAAISPYPHGG